MKFMGRVLRGIAAVAWLGSLGGPAAADDLPSYYQRYRFLSAPPATWGDGLLGFANPANLGFLNKPEMRFLWDTGPQQVWGFRDWGVYAAVPHLGFSVQSQEVGTGTVTDYRLGLAAGSRAASLGLAYGWSGASNGAPQPENLFSASLVSRPIRFLSLGVTSHITIGTEAYEFVGELGIRPFGTPAITLFADASWARQVAIADVPWSMGAAIRPTPGVDLVGRYFDSEAFTLSLAFNFGHTGAATQSYVDPQGEYAGQAWGVRVGGLRPGFSTGPFQRGRHFTSISTRGQVRYLKYRFLDDGAPRLWQVLDDVRSAADDPRVSVIALQVSSLKILPEHAWEIREALRAARETGKKVIVFLDDAGMNGYHLASVADFVVMDPQGMLVLPGYLVNRTYFKGSLAKLGLAFDAWRLYEYKSAAEALSREDMSAADREQNQRLVDACYEQTRTDVSASRPFSPEQFDSIIDRRVIITADSAKVIGLVDTLARWSDVDAVVDQLTRRNLNRLSPGGLLAHGLDTETWGARSRIALVYGLGVCDLDRGIRARWLERLFLRLAQDRSIRAVVFRVDSPGGDPLASDLVAEALKKCSRRKPVIVSMGQVAASGGYWISMYGDSVFAGPTTVTGSIGVIGGWLYDDGLGEKLGMTSDHVQRGAHADALAGIRLPLLGETIPQRNLTDEEKEMALSTVRDLYGQFVHKVARGRGLALNEVNRLGEGRVYSGTEAVANNLVDDIGGLLYAIEVARRKSHAGGWRDLEIVEFPGHRGFLNLPWLRGNRVDWEAEDPVIEAARQIIEAAGRPLPMTLPGTYPEPAD